MDYASRISFSPHIFAFVVVAQGASSISPQEKKGDDELALSTASLFAAQLVSGIDVAGVASKKTAEDGDPSIMSP
jgi:hypothetical protein